MQSDLEAARTVSSVAKSFLNVLSRFYTRGHLEESRKRDQGDCLCEKNSLMPIGPSNLAGPDRIT